MTEHPNAVTVWRSFEAWNSGRVDVIREYLSEGAVLHFAGNNAMSGTYRGRDAVMDALGRASQGWGPHVEVEALLASDDHVIAFFHGSERDGETLDAVTAMPMKVNAEGKLTEIWLLGGDQRAFDQFWS
jgi:ketosteroid isomerase-like protein